MTIARPFDFIQDKASPNRNIFPITAEIDQNGRLKVGGCLLSSLAQQYGTPLYVLDESTFRQSCKAYKDALNNYYNGESLVLYASKANSSLAITSLAKSEGIGIDVVSEGELITALKVGMPTEKIFFHGNNKSYRELLFAYNNEVNIVLDNQHDIDLLGKIIQPGNKPAKLMLRFTPGIECHTHEYIRTGHLDSKFGFDLDRLEDTLIQLKQYSWANLTGLHAHIGSQIFELAPHIDLAEVLADALKKALGIGHPISDLNVGGGLGIKYISSDDPPSINNWVEAVSNSLEDSCKRRSLNLPRLLCEPGRSIVAPAGLTLYRIGSRKEIPGIRTYISVDGGMSDNPRPITYESAYTACLVDKPLSEPQETITIAGKHCESGDVLLKDYQLPSFSSGDILSICGTGAYNASMSSNYNRIPKPATVLVGSGKSELIQKRELPEDLLRYDMLPDRFIAEG